MTTKKAAPPECIPLQLVLSEVYRCYRLLVVSTLVGVVVSCIYAFNLPDEYQANALMQVERKTQGITLTRVDRLLQGLKASSALDMTLIRSRRVIGAAVDELNLQIEIQPKRIPIFGKMWNRMMAKEEGSVAVSHLYLPEAIDGEPENMVLTVLKGHQYKITYRRHTVISEIGKLTKQSGLEIRVADISASPGSKFTITYHSRRDAIDDVFNNLIVMTPARNSDLIKLTLLGKDRKLTKKVLASILQNHVKYNIEDSSKSQRKGLELLSQQLPIIRQQLKVDEDALSGAKQHTALLNVEGKVLSLIEQKMIIQDRLNQIMIEAIDISNRYSRSHPVFKVFMQKQKYLYDENERLKIQIQNIPHIQQRILNLSNLVEVESNIYARALYRQQQLKILAAAAISNLRVIDSAVDESESSTLAKLNVVLQGALIGLFGSLTYILFIFSIRNTFTSPFEFHRRMRNRHPYVKSAPTL